MNHTWRRRGLPTKKVASSPWTASKPLRVSIKMISTRLPLPKFLIMWRISGSTQGVSCTKKKLARIQRQKALRWWERSALDKGTTFFVKYLKTMVTFSFPDLHHLLAMERWTLRDWWASTKRSSSKVGRMMEPKSHSPIIALNSFMVRHSSTPLNWKTWQIGTQNSAAACKEAHQYWFEGCEKRKRYQEGLEHPWSWDWAC